MAHHSASFSLTLRARLDDRPGTFADLARAIADAGGLLDAIDLVRVNVGSKTRDVSVLACWAVGGLLAAMALFRWQPHRPRQRRQPYPPQHRPAVRRLRPPEGRPSRRRKDRRVDFVGERKMGEGRQRRLHPEYRERPSGGQKH